MARQAPHESARTRKRGRDLGPASQFPRDRPLAGFARSAAAPVRAARHSIARTQCHFAGGRLCAGVRGKAACISRNGRGAAGGRARVEGPRAVSRARGRPALAARVRQCEVAPLLAGVDEALLKPPVNVLRLSLHPSGLASRIANLTEWRAHLLMRLRTQIGQTADAVLIDLLAELSKFPATNMLKPLMPPPRDETAGVFVPFQLVTDAGKLSFLSTTTVFGTPIDVTLSELALECFFPADDATAQALQR